MNKDLFKIIRKPLRQSTTKEKEKPKIGVKNYNGPLIPRHFQKHPIVTYSEVEIQAELEKYPGLFKTLGHAYEYQIIVINKNNRKDYWFCQNAEYSVPLIQYLEEKGWEVDWQEKPFALEISNERINEFRINEFRISES